MVCTADSVFLGITLTGNYVPFGEFAGAVARMVAEVRGAQIDEGDIDRLQQAVAILPPHPEVLGAPAAGWKTALILRTGNAPLAVGGQPDISGSNLNDIAEKLCQIHI